MADKGGKKGGDKAGGGKSDKGDKDDKPAAPAKGGDKKEPKKDDKKVAAGAAAPKHEDGKKEAAKKAPAASAGDKADKPVVAVKPAMKSGDDDTGAVGDETTTTTTETAARKHAPFRKFFYRGHEVHKLLDLSHVELMKLMTARVRRRFARGHVPMNLIRKLRKAKKEAAPGDKPKVVKTHQRNMIIVPEMVASIVGVYNGLNFTQVEIKPDMIGHYLGEFSISYKPVKHGRPGVGATNSSRFIPLK